ncbi:MAG: hypothetical protein A3C90_00765 [Candidatus Magasanikbacteria bacterium RIFCSPHIGHO2_02_FULL_51_14]|uniref:Uncharacterized protein n=1 Tax=Candidatus Magasanikbacteria bacterium RIFCSPHIGHO2_02_FULL_51_14 TaxID=1798683 RepID=A0A1F6MQD4_9BACT|nr:MAG: hypothetical protein A3C90_00765 [Candidatus Magasanikbacteria bacterium RIFCSPHIGHO2_02_FULL_51_14]
MEGKKLGVPEAQPAEARETARAPEGPKTLQGFSIPETSQSRERQKEEEALRVFANVEVGKNVSFSVPDRVLEAMNLGINTSDILDQVRAETLDPRAALDQIAEKIEEQKRAAARRHVEVASAPPRKEKSAEPSQHPTVPEMAKKPWWKFGRGKK